MEDNIRHRENNLCCVVEWNPYKCFALRPVIHQTSDKGNLHYVQFNLNTIYNKAVI